MPGQSRDEPQGHLLQWLLRPGLQTRFNRQRVLFGFSLWPELSTLWRGKDLLQYGPRYRAALHSECEWLLLPELGSAAWVGALAPPRVSAGSRRLATRRLTSVAGLLAFRSDRRRERWQGIAVDPGRGAGIPGKGRLGSRLSGGRAHAYDLRSSSYPHPQEHGGTLGTRGTMDQRLATR